MFNRDYSDSFYNFYNRERLRQDRELAREEMAQREHHHKEMLRELRRQNMTPEERAYEEQVHHINQDIASCRNHAQQAIELLAKYGSYEEDEVEKLAAKINEIREALDNRILELTNELLELTPPEGSTITNWSL